jgi:hypothetical protein
MCTRSRRGFGCDNNGSHRHGGKRRAATSMPDARPAPDCAAAGSPDRDSCTGTPLAELPAMTSLPDSRSEGIVAAFPRRARASEHEVASLDAQAARLAALLGRRYVPDYRPSRHGGGVVPYYVPDLTIIGARRAAVLGIVSETDLYGGVAPHAFVATKSISHGLVGPQASRPASWSMALADMLGDAVLEGYTAFCPEDALAAGRRLLARGTVRVKPADATAGRGQVVVRSLDALQAALAEQSPRLMQRLGLVLEEDLEETAGPSCAWRAAVLTPCARWIFARMSDAPSSWRAVMTRRPGPPIRN